MLIYVKIKNSGLTLSSHIIMRHFSFTILRREPIESRRHGGASLGDIIFVIEPSRQIRGLLGSTIIA